MSPQAPTWPPNEPARPTNPAIADAAGPLGRPGEAAPALQAAGAPWAAPPLGSGAVPSPSATTGIPMAGAAPGAAPGANPPLGLEGYCPVSLVEKGKWIPGDRRWGWIHRGRTYLFAGPDEHRQFNADPDRYAPVLGGNDVVRAVESGQMVPGYRRHGVFFGERIYLFADEAALEKFSRDPNYYTSLLTRSAQAAAEPAAAPRW